MNFNMEFFEALNVESFDELDSDMKGAFLVFVKNFPEYKAMVEAGKIPEHQLEECIDTLTENKNYIMLFIISYQLAVDNGKGEEFERMINEIKEVMPD